MGMILDGVGTSNAIDSSSEILSIEGHDISELNTGNCLLNFEHLNDSPENILGRILSAKKIFKKDDCSNERERKYWDFVKGPFVYIKAELFDDPGSEHAHAGATALAAIVRYSHKRGEKLLLGFSVEGSTLEREKNVLKRTVSRRYACTFRPCNKQAIAGMLEDSAIDKEIKKYIKYDQSIDPTNFHIDSCILEDTDQEDNSLDGLKKSLLALQKTLTAAGGNVAPSQLTQGAALTPEGRVKGKIKQILTTWDRKRPLKEVVKAALPDINDSYLEHFADMAQELSLKKSNTNLVRIDPHHSSNKNMNEEQKQLITGLYHDPNAVFHGNDELSVPRNKMFNLKNDASKDVLVKVPTAHEGANNAAITGTNYYHMAKNFFGLGDHVPVTTHIDHPAFGGKTVQAMAYHPSAVTGFHMNSNNINQNARENGDAHKLAIMDMVTNGDIDRHHGNVLYDNGKIMHIDNDEAFDYNSKSPHLAHYVEPTDTMHKDAAQWLDKLDPKLMASHMKGLGMDRNQQKEAVKRLLTLKELSRQGKSLGEMHKTVNGKV